MAEKKIRFDRVGVSERAALGCRNPHPTPQFTRAYKVVTSRKVSHW